MELAQDGPFEEVSEWTYVMRRTMQEILPGLFLGPYSSASKSKLDALLDNGITHIVCIRQDVESHIIRPHFRDKFKYLVLDIKDTNTENILKHFPAVCLFIDDALTHQGRCLVHGNAGISRSAAFVMAYVMQKYGLNAREAFITVQQRRFCINPNDGFMAQLAEFEPIYRAQQIRTNGQSSTENSRNKRRIGDVDDRLFDVPVTEASDITNKKRGLVEDCAAESSKIHTTCCFHVENSMAACHFVLDKFPQSRVEPMEHDCS